jgi:TetR/AcrR family transcriptional repressor of nem operon
MRDLAEQLGLHLGSVYNALGDKEKVFEAALRLNFEEQVLPRVKALQDEPDALKAIDAYLNWVVDEAIGVSPGPGCFVVNSLLEIAHINDNITKLVHGYTAQIETMMSNVVARAQKAGQIKANRDPKKLAQFIISMCVDIRAMSNSAPRSSSKRRGSCAGCRTGAWLIPTTSRTAPCASSGTRGTRT